MKLKGIEIKGMNVISFGIPRGEECFEFRAQAVTNMADFEAMCPEPKPRIKQFPGGVTELDINQPEYKEALNKYNEKRSAFLILQSLRATADLEWETVDYAVPDTWVNYVEELRSSGFSQGEISHIIKKVLEANALNENQLDAAYERFLALKQAAVNQE